MREDRREKLIARYKETGDKSVRRAVVRGNLRFVWYVLDRKVQRLTEDLLQEGVIGMIEAMDDYEVGHDANFLTYAPFHIHKRIWRHLHKTYTHLYVANYAFEQLYGFQGESPQKLAEQSDLSVDLAHKALVARMPLPFNEYPVPPREWTEEKAGHRADLRALCVEFYESMTDERRQKVFQEVMLQGKSYAAMGRKMSLHRESIRLTAKSVAQCLRDFLRRQRGWTSLEDIYPCEYTPTTTPSTTHLPSTGRPTCMDKTGSCTDSVSFPGKNWGSS